MFNNTERKEQRLHQSIPANKEISARFYNLVLGGSVAYGLLANALSVYMLEDFFLGISPKTFLIVYFISCIAGTIISVCSKNPIISFLGYNLIVLPIGGLLTICLREYNISDILASITVTGIVAIAMMIAAVAHPDFFRGLGRTLFLALVLGLIGEIIATLLGYGGNIFHWAFIVLFSLYIGYDYVRAQDYPKTIDNAIDSAIDIYLDIINLFIRILEILGKNKD